MAYVTNPGFKPVPSAELSGKAVMLAGGKREEIALLAGEGNSLTGERAAPAAGKPTAVRFAVG